MPQERSATAREFICRHCQEPISTSELMEVYAFREDDGASPRPVTLHYPRCASAFEGTIAVSERFRWQRWYGRRHS